MTPTPARQEPDNVWDFFSLSPEMTHMFTWLYGDRGIPASFRHMDGFGSHTFQWMNAKGEAFWVKYHFKTDQGIKCLTLEEATRIAGADPDYHGRDLSSAIGRGEYPSWTLKMQIMPLADAAKYRFNPFDVTKVWPYKDYPLKTVGRFVLDRNPENYFAEVEQAGFDPANFVLPESGLHLTGCSRAGCSRMPMRIATGWASTTPNCRSTVPTRLR